MSTQSTTEAGPTQGIWRAGFYAAGVAAIINVVIFVVGTLVVPNGLAVTGIPGAEGATPVPWFMVILMTVIPVLLGTVAYWVLCRYLPRQAKPIFIVGVLIVALASTVGPATSTEDTTTAILLGSMHLVAGGVLIWAMTRQRST